MQALVWLAKNDPLLEVVGVPHAASALIIVPRNRMRQRHIDIALIPRIDMGTLNRIR